MHGLELVAGWRRMQGIVFRSGDKRFEGLSAQNAVRAALADPACIMVNRNQGAGTRILIDRLLGAARPDGYWNQPRSHNAVAAAVAQNWPGFLGSAYFLLHVGSPAAINPGNPAAPSGGTANVTTSAIFDPSFSILNIAIGQYAGRLLTTGYANLFHTVLYWNTVGNTGSNIKGVNNDGVSTQTCIQLIGDGTHTPGVNQLAPVTPSKPYNVSFWVKSSASPNSLFASLTWLDSNFSVIGSVITNTITGPDLSWVNPSFDSIIAPANAAYLAFQVAIAAATTAGQWWQVTDVFVQTIVSQSSNGQTNTLVPANQFSGSGQQVAGAVSNTTAAKSIYGLGQSYIISAASTETTSSAPGYVDAFDSATGWTRVFGGAIVCYSTLGISAGALDLGCDTTGGFLQLINTSGSDQAVLRHDGFTTIGPGITPYTGTGFIGGIARHCPVGGSLIPDQHYQHLNPSPSLLRCFKLSDDTGGRGGSDERHHAYHAHESAGSAKLLL